MTDQSSTLEEAYFDRNQAVMVLARFAQQLGYSVGLGVDTQEPDWPVLIVTLPDGSQVSWHLPKDELVGRWPFHPWGWDGHDLEMKRKRIGDFLRFYPHG